jgi:hypothetical protein
MPDDPARVVISCRLSSSSLYAPRQLPGKIVLIEETRRLKTVRRRLERYHLAVANQRD